MFLYGDLSFLEISGAHCKYRMKESILLDSCSCIVAMTLVHKVF